MQVVLYNKQTKKIVNVFQDAEVKNRKIKHNSGITIFGDGLDVVFVENETISIKKINDFTFEFKPDNITNLKVKRLAQTAENEIETLKKEIEKLKEIITEK